MEKDALEAVIWYLKSAKQNHADAQCDLGNCYEKGGGVPQNTAEALKRYTKAAEQGYGKAQKALERLTR